MHRNISEEEFEFIMSNKDLSFRAKGMFAYICSRGMRQCRAGASLAQLLGVSTEGGNAVRSALSELLNSNCLFEVEKKEEYYYYVDVAGISRILDKLEYSKTSREERSSVDRRTLGELILEPTSNRGPFFGPFFR